MLFKDPLANHMWERHKEHRSGKHDDVKPLVYGCPDCMKMRPTLAMAPFRIRT